MITVYIRLFHVETLPCIYVCDSFSSTQHFSMIITCLKLKIIYRCISPQKHSYFINYTMCSKFFFKVVNRQDGWAQPYDEPRLLSFNYYYYMWQWNNSENHVQTSVNKLLLLLLLMYNDTNERR